MSGTRQDDGDDEKTDVERDDALDDTFPASDPVSIGGSTGPEDTKPA